MAERLKFALFGNIYQAKKSASVKQLISLLTARGAELYIDTAFYTYLKQELHFDVIPTGLISDSDFQADIAVSMGGDGTFLAAASRVGNKDIPILGINMGRLGFLADVSPEEINECIDDIYNHTYKIDERSVIEVKYEGPELSGYPYALNEVAVLKRDNSSMISIRVEVNGEFLATYQADGLIINTPTGSTGYALSVGGPIIVPQSGTFCITPVASHSLNARPITLRDQVELTLSVESRNHNFLVAIDGRSEACTEATRLILRRAPNNIKVLQRKNHSFYSTLREKLMWGADPREESC